MKARTKKGTFAPSPKTPLERFAEKCAFDPVTGCVMWIGGTSSGHGHNEPYGRFWFEGEMWYAHRWAAIHIHGHEITDMQVDHNCPAGPSTLCVQHVKPETLEVNRELQHSRPGRALQSLQTRQYWLFVSIGIEPYKPRLRSLDGVPFYDPPAWLAPFLKPMEATGDEPF